MTGSHEVRGSIPLGSTNNFNSLQAVQSSPQEGKKHSIFLTLFTGAVRRGVRGRRSADRSAEDLLLDQLSANPYVHYAP